MGADFVSLANAPIRDQGKKQVIFQWATILVREQSVDDLVDIEELDEARAAALIMTARAPWFEVDDTSDSNTQ